MTVFHMPRLWAICAATCTAIVAAAPQHRVTPHAPKESVIMDSRGSMKAGHGLIRRESENSVPDVERTSGKASLYQRYLAHQRAINGRQGHQREAPALLEVKAARKHGTKRDAFVLLGDNRCDGGGLWKHYVMDAVRPGNYEFCASDCNSKDECVGFDVGTNGCRMYTNKAVAIGSWASVKFSDGAPFPGVGVHDDFAPTPYDLTLGTTLLASGDVYHCYRKTDFAPVESYYWLIGNHTCSGPNPAEKAAGYAGGLWKRYKLSPATTATCTNACSQRDECVAFDVGTWYTEDITLQASTSASSFSATPQNTTGCFLYTQKAVFGQWPAVQSTIPESGSGYHDFFPENPYQLTPGFVSHFEVGNGTQCYGKTHWVNLDQYYIELGQQLCEGGGAWKHYKIPHGTFDACMLKCDMKDDCVGIDFSESPHIDASEGSICEEAACGVCRLYTRIAMASESWDGVTFSASNSSFPGSGTNVDKYPPTPFSLVPDAGPANTAKSCMAKSHYETMDQDINILDDR